MLAASLTILGGPGAGPPAWYVHEYAPADASAVMTKESGGSAMRWTFCSSDRTRAAPAGQGRSLVPPRLPMTRRRTFTATA